MKSIHLKLDFRSGDPIYLQIVRQIQDLVAKGEMSEGDQLPTVRQLASELRVNFNTVARAYRMLDDAGVISTQQGRGTFLLDSRGDRLDQKIKQASLEDKIRNAIGSWLEEGYRREEILEEIQKVIESQDLESSKD